MSDNLNEEELKRFEKIANEWWYPEGKFKPLHLLNPVRANYIDQKCQGLAEKNILDIGCGGGLLCEALAQRGANVIGIDRGKTAIEVARRHAKDSNLKIEYLLNGSEELAEKYRGYFDVVCCLELLEHVPDPARTVRDCADLVKTGGTLFFSTINRNPISWLVAIFGAEYVLNWLPRGTHDYQQLIRPDELGAWIRDANLTQIDIKGMHYRPWAPYFVLARNVAINYIVMAKK